MLRTSKVLAALAVVTGVAGIALVAGALTEGQPGQSTPPPVAAPAWHPVEVIPVPPAAVPEKDLVVSASAPLRLEIPSLKNGSSHFDSSTFAGGTSNPIQEWTKAMNDEASGIVTPPGSWESSIVWDSTVAGGGLFGTDAQSNGRILAHTTPLDWSPLGAFNPLNLVPVGVPVVITTEKGRLCYNVIKSDGLTRKSQLNTVYGKNEVIPGIAYLITCSRTSDNPHGRTTNNLVITLQLNQQQTNTGSC